MNAQAKKTTLDKIVHIRPFILIGLFKFINYAIRQYFFLISFI